MADSKPRRGRPKGTGIDDDRRLREIARLLVAEPELKPTTAIRSLGYTNPSAVRRLRDKLNADLQGLLSMARKDLGIDRGAPIASAPNPTRHPMARTDTATRQTSNGTTSETAPSVVRAEERPMPRHVTGVHEADDTCETTGNDARMHASHGSDSASRWIELSFQAGAVAMRHHVRVCAQLAKVPSVAVLLQHQMLLAELLVGGGFPNSMATQTRH